MRDKNADQFHAFYERHIDPLYRLARRRVGAEEAEDLVAEAFVQAFKHLPPHLLEDDDGARAWLFVVLRNRLSSDSRRRATVARKQFLVALPAASEDEYALDGALEEALDELPDRQRTVLELRFVADLDVPSVARMMKLTEEAVRALTYRALRSMRRVLGHADGSAGSSWAGARRHG